MEGIIGHHQAQPRRCTVSTLSLGKWLVEWRHLCFSSVAFGGSLVELIRRFKLAGPNLASYTWNGTYVFVRACLCLICLQVTFRHGFTDIKYISKRDLYCIIVSNYTSNKLDPSLLSLFPGLNPELSSVRFLRCTSTNIVACYWVKPVLRSLIPGIYSTSSLRCACTSTKIDNFSINTMNLRMQRLPQTRFIKTYPKRLISPYLPSDVAYIKLKYTD